MITRYPKYPYVLAIIFGIVAFFIPVTNPFSISLAIVFLFAGGLLGFFWPKESWRWGFWVATPMLAFLGPSLLFAGQLDVFLKKDLPQLLFVIATACLGSFIAARYKQKRAGNR